MRRLALLYVLCSVSVYSWAQLPVKNSPVSNLRKKTITTRQAVISLDSLSIVPHTLVVAGLPDSAYAVDLVSATLSWRQKIPIDSVQVTYRVFNHKLNSVTKRLTFDSIQNNFLAKPFTYRDPASRQEERFFNFGNINYNGSFGRGISFGNSQDAVVTSNLNLQMNGFLADSIEIAAAITDNNIPIQPDGTTQQLNEFDRIFLQFKKRGWQLNLGDIDIRQNSSYFLNFYKRLQGGAFETTTRVAPGITNTALVSGSIAKGKFTRNIFQGQEGNQGPYRLTGANSEFFFVVLANTERVFINGELMQRGEDQDYVINYNTAEVTFTPKQMITKDSRIQIEFEYADRNYLNTNIYLSNETNFNNRLKVRVSAFNNRDAKSSPINQTLDVPQKVFLNNLGDSVSKAFFPLAPLDSFSDGKILYKKIDSTNAVSGHTDTVFVYSINPDSARYNLSFIDVGQGNGDYVPEFSGANGKVYKWVAPKNEARQGRFAPAAYLVTPKKQQVASVSMEYAASKNTSVITEFGYSNYDVNAFSAKDKANDKGYAARMQVKNLHRLGDSVKNIQLQTDASFEYVDARFKPLERLRNVEFTRDWGLPYIVPPANETIVNAGVQLSDSRKNLLRYQFTSYGRANEFKGFRNSLFHTQMVQGWQFNNQAIITKTNSVLERGYFFRPTIDVARQLVKLKNYVAGASYSLEHNEIHNKLTDSVSLASFEFETLKIYLKSPEKNLNRWGITYFTRKDKYPSGKQLSRADRSQNLNIFTELLKNERHQFRLNVTYRELDVFKQNLTDVKPDRSLLGRAEYQVNGWKGVVTGNILYEVGAGQEQKRDYAFFKVPAGQGQYVWIDYDTNGVAGLNEFELAQFQDQAEYIRIFTPSNEYIKANYNTFNYSFSLNPRAAIDAYKARGLSKLLTRINMQSSLQIFKKETASGMIQLNPFINALNDTSLITLTSVFINTLSFNRFSTRWGFDLSNSRNNGKALLTYGYESRKFEDWTLRGRFNFYKSLSFDLIFKKGINALSTSNNKFGNRNYLIDIYSVEPRINYTRGGNFRVITGYKYTDKKNGQNDLEVYHSHAVSTEIKYNILQSSSVLGKITFSDIDFMSRKNQVANANSTVSYIILDGLLPGKNYLWNLDLTKRLSNNLEMTIQYEGRKPGTARVVHIGRATLRALL